MSYNSNGFYFLILFFIILFFSFIFRNYKYINILLPYKGTFKFISLIQYFLILLIFLILSLLPFNFGIYQGKTIVTKPVLNIEILFDVSLSMTINDIKPDRFSAAKESLIYFINNLNNNYNIGMITFSGVPIVYIPFTNNKKAIIWKIEYMKMSDFPPSLDFVGTAIGDAILLGVKKLNEYTNNLKKPGVIILFTDGDTNKGVNPLKAVNIANKYDIPIFVGAIGNRKNYVVGKDKFGNDVNTNIDLNILKKIAENSGGEFLQIKDKKDFLKILTNISNYVKKTEEKEEKLNYLYINYYLKILLFILLFLYFLLFIRFNIKK